MAFSEPLGSGVTQLAHGPREEVVPQQLTPLRLLTGWEWELLPALAVAVVAVSYLLGVAALRRRGAPWSPWRTMAFCLGGLGGIVLATQSALAAYDTTLLWVHMVQHMVLSMAVPLFLALGAPVTLALRTLPQQPRGLLLRLLHSRYAQVVSFPAVSGVLFVATPFALYFTGWYEATLRNPWLHDFTHLHFVLVGCLWFWPLVGPDPVPGRLPHVFRLLAVLVTLPFHAFLGVALMSGPPLAAGWYSSLGRGWGPTPERDTEIAGGVLWGAGDVVGLLVAGVLVAQWFAASDRESAREDRRLDRLDARVQTPVADSFASVASVGSAAAEAPVSHPPGSVPGGSGRP